MAKACEYCKGLSEDDALKCQNCGAPLTTDCSADVDYRTCPYCRRKLLALASPACNHCGRRLPEEYIKARESDLRRITEIEEGNPKTDINGKVGEVIRQTARRKRGRSSIIDLTDIADLTDLFS
jgi:hypothetical protein